jgi:hypothetical protein
MNPNELEEFLLLRDSGELDAASERRLEKALAQDPALRQKAEEARVLLHAGRWASDVTTPALSEIARERILRQSQRSSGRFLPRVLAAAALVLLGIGLWPHVASRFQPVSETLIAVTPVEAPPQQMADLEQPVLPDLDVSDLDSLQEELKSIATQDLHYDLATGGDPESWAQELLGLEDSI